MFNLITYKFRIKDSTTSKRLNRMANSVNLVWNYCNETSMKAIRYNRKWLSDYDLHDLSKGCGKELGIHSHTIKRICTEYVIRRQQSKKSKLNWRSKKRSLGWIPFVASNTDLRDDVFIYRKQKFRLWKSREIEGELVSGSFNQDSRGRWYVNLQCRVETAPQIGVLDIGVDLGIKTQATLSDGRKYSRENLTRLYEEKLASAQRAHKKKRVTAIHTKIANARKDWNHKTANSILNNARLIVVGDISSTKLAKTYLAESVLDSSWGQLKSILAYKSKRLGVEFKEQSEMFSSVTCSSCLKRTGPSGLSNLGVREWICSECQDHHDRDINAAKNILRMGLHTPIKGIS